MNFLSRISIALAVACAIAGCEPKEVDETVWDDQIKTMDKAREVEDKLMNRADQLRRDVGQDDEEDPPQ
ncbi:MAG: hypothetical protein KJO54_03435 [Gammaproteobacteria bacterium]|nr:hypothetical protein [Gammaproteobacteria bacterium]NNF61399.1 hypothetical protein [Gammaproteobacteria bacterium]